MDPLKPELDRAYQQYFGQRGGVAPDLAGQVLPVVVMDDSSMGPYPPCRIWEIGSTLGAVAAQFAYQGILNADAANAKSAVVVDYVIVGLTTAPDFVGLGITTAASLPLGTLANVEDCAPEKEQPGTFGAALGNVQRGQLNQVAALGQIAGPYLVNTGYRIDGPWILGPGQIFFIRSGSVNQTISGFFRGRYYPPS